MERPHPRPISIWSPEERNGRLCFVRPDPLPFGDHYAATSVLQADKPPDTRRICFLGESVAAGYLYAPHLTPAGLLETQLCRIAGSDSYEVVDLARTNETLSGLVSTARAALQLRPDVLMLFAGNNWNLLETPDISPYVPTPSARRRYGSNLREDGIIGPIEAAARQQLQKAAQALSEIDEIARSASIPVILIIPEVNLADWENRQPVTWLPHHQTASWYGYYEAALRSFAAQDWEALERTARAMIELDQHTCPTSYRLLATALRGKHDLHNAREACMAEIDCNQYATMCFLGAPQVSLMAQSLQRRSASHHGFITVDLPDIFERYTGTPLPGRRMFLDYCHLTVEGMHIAMAAASAAVLRLFDTDRQDLLWSKLIARLPDPDISPEAEATAAFGAAIHNAHRLLTVGPKAPILEYWCREALNRSPGIEQAMLDFVTARTAPCPAVMTHAQQRNYASPYCLGFQHGWNYDYLDADVIEAVQTILEQAGRPFDTRLLLERRPLLPEGIDLVHPGYYLAEPLERCFTDVMSYADLTPRAMHRSPWPVSSFALPCNGNQDVALDLTARLPTSSVAPESIPLPVKITVNGRQIGRIRLHTDWHRRSFRLDGQYLKTGLNRISLHWPMPSLTGEDAFRSVVRRLEAGRAADLHPIFGEVFSLHAHPC